MSLTYKQKHNLLITSLVTVAAAIVGVCIWLIVMIASSAPSVAAVRTVPAPQVNASRFEQIHTQNSDGTVDHYCLGATGLFFGQYTGEFAVEKNDPLCSGK